MQSLYSIKLLMPSGPLAVRSYEHQANHPTNPCVVNKLDSERELCPSLSFIWHQEMFIRVNS